VLIQHFASIIRLLLLTGCRLNEIAGLEWKELSDDLATVSLPGRRTKNSLPHVVKGRDGDAPTPFPSSSVTTFRRIIAWTHHRLVENTLAPTSNLCAHEIVRGMAIFDGYEQVLDVACK
jgi:integrase